MAPNAKIIFEILFAIPALRSRGVNLAIVTLGLGLALDALLFKNKDYTGGFTGTRLTVVFARTLAQQLAIPLHGYSSFLLMAHRLAAPGQVMAEVPRFWLTQELPRRGVVAGCYGSATNGAMAELEPPRLFRAGDGLPAEHMVLRLRNNLLGRAQQKLMTTPAHFTQAMVGVIRVWNATREGRNIAHIGNAFRLSNEPFPAIK